MIIPLYMDCVQLKGPGKMTVMIVAYSTDIIYSAVKRGSPFHYRKI
jgi:hypothetical protein